MNNWSSEVELREENGEVHAYAVHSNRKITIPKFPEPTIDMNEWLFGLSLDSLEAARQYYLDHWTWEDDADRYRLLVDLISSHIHIRVVSLDPQSKHGRTTLDLTHIQRNRASGLST